MARLRAHGSGPGEGPPSEGAHRPPARVAAAVTRRLDRAFGQAFDKTLGLVRLTPGWRSSDQAFDKTGQTDARLEGSLVSKRPVW